ncbi:META domain-containing protein [Flavobacterium sp. 5]|uniref:META domain-containing protein n=1 Tax=Flavobacterium sp. 5 TaxID=2035199 RepID=UPI000C2B58DC|nr:META domain-containing protein [Flavobacterium sp. 5]PKB18877.1 heat shock protein HslJ [Flavobacterium sp. 5]
MKKAIQLLVIALFFICCKTNSSAPKIVENNEPTFAYKQQIENLEKGIYFRANGNEPDWSLKISEKTIEFASSKQGYEALNGNHVEPIRGIDANVKMYQVSTEAGTMTIQIMQQECVNKMSGDKSSYSVQIEILKKNQSIHLLGCGNYITDPRLHDIWVLEKLNGENVTVENFTKELPNLEINSTTNTFMGFSGCNKMGGSIFFEKGLLRFTNVVTTEMACRENNKEAIFLKALQSTTNYKVENLRLTLANPSGSELVFRKVD